MCGIGYVDAYCHYHASKKMTREKRLPFEVSIDPFYSEANMAALEQSMQQRKEGKVIIKSFEELEAMENEQPVLY